MEITGINTSTLPVLTDKEREILIIKMKQGDKRAREILVISNLKLVLSVIQKINIVNKKKKGVNFLLTFVFIRDIISKLSHRDVESEQNQYKTKAKSFRKKLKKLSKKY